MTKLTKKKKQLLELVNPENIYSLEEAMNIFQTVKSNKFDESVDIALRLGIDPGKSDQNVRGAITLPHSLGKTVSVAVFADGDQAKEANDAGADFVGMEDLAEKFKKEEIEVDVVISSQAAMKIVGQLGQVLGPKGLMPNPKTGTVTEKVGEDNRVSPPPAVTRPATCAALSSVRITVVPTATTRPPLCLVCSMAATASSEIA